MDVDYYILHDMNSKRPIKSYDTLEEVSLNLKARYAMYGAEAFGGYAVVGYSDGNMMQSLQSEDLLLWAMAVR